MPVRPDFKLKILLADDDLEEHYILALASQQHPGIAIDFVNNGAALLSNLENEIPDIIFLDLAMPGLSGQQCLRAIRADPRFDAVPVVIYTGSRASDQIEYCRQQKSNLYAVKQPTIEKLQVMLDTIFNMEWEVPPVVRAEDEFVVGI